MNQITFVIHFNYYFIDRIVNDHMCTGEDVRSCMFIID